MKLLTQILCLGLAAAACFADEVEVVDGGLTAVPVPVEAEGASLDRCEGMEMDAITLDENHVPLFFKGDQMFEGINSRSGPMNSTIEEVDGLDHVDAAFIMDFDPKTVDHDDIVFFQKNQVFLFNHGKLVEGYPKNITEEFPGIPDDLDAAVECPAVDCGEDYVIFFKGGEVFHFNMHTKAIEMRDFMVMPNCTSALRLIDQYYCFVGEQFSKFNPNNGVIHPRYPKDNRDYFMKCPPKPFDCSKAHLDAMTSHGKDLYSFRENHYVHKDLLNDFCSRSQICEDGSITLGPIASVFEQVQNDLDAAFAYNNHFYMMKDHKMYIYTTGENHTLVDDSNSTVRTELGVDGPIDAAFVCDDHPDVHFMKGDKLYGVDMRSGVPRNVTSEVTVPLFPEVDATLCGSDGLNVIVGHNVYHFANIKEMVAATVLPEANVVARALFNC